MKQTLRLVSAIFLFLFFNGIAFGQASACPQVTVAPAGPICAGNCVNLAATVQGSVATTSYAVSNVPYSPYSYTTGTSVLINIDDTWSGAITIPFCFQFFGNTYTQLLIGSNGLVTFDLTQANGYCQWPINNAIPSNLNPMNSIMAPFQDSDPSIGTPTSATDINWKVVGTAPCREFIVSWYDVAMFSCNTQIVSSQMVLHETTNIIDIYILNKTVCAAWNGGAAIEGIQNATGTVAYAVAGRNFPTQWTASNDGKRFMPNGAQQYTLNWTGPSGSLGSANPITVCPTTTSTYTCTVTNTTCSGPIVVNASTTVVVTSGLTTSGSQTNSTSCTACNGTATTTVTTGTGPFTYAWLPSGGNAATATNLCPGTYTCTVTNPSGCTGTQTFTIAGPSSPTSTQSNTNVSCNGGCNGTATIVPNPAAAYTYAWTPNVGNTATVTGLCAGTYTVIATNAGGCTTTQTITITQPTALAATQSQTNILCNGACTGTATVNASGGTPGYTYSWAPSGGSAATTTGRCAGTYTCTITDANGCVITRTFNITQPTLLNATSSSTPATCGGNTGTATASPSGGTPGYTYSWNSVPVQTTATATGLPAGSYTCTITDANGCTRTVVAVVGSTGGITASITASSNVSCFGGNNGSATATPSGGTAPYTYSWNTAPVQNTATATGLGVGSYTCTIIDANGCVATVTVSITQPTQVTATQSQVNVLCNAACTGSATVVASGGTPGYTYLWTPSGGTGPTASARCAGTYTCTITDANGCVITRTFSITQPTAITATTTTTPSTCGNPNGTATVTPGGGTPGYTYSWNTVPVQTTATATGLIAGSYTVTVTDANGCTRTATATVTNSGGPTASISASTNISCFGGSTGSATATATGGTAPYSYSWNSTPVQNTATATGLPAGSYTVTVTDANLCTTTATVTLTQNPAITATQSQVNVLCNGSCTGVATVVASGGTGTYTYAWLPSGGTGASASSLCAGTYTCTISSPAGCSITQTFFITQPPVLTATTSQVNLLCNGGNTGTATVNPSGGTPGYSYSWNTAPVQTTATATGLTAGSYTCTITDANGCVITRAVLITQPTPVTGSTTTTASTCGNPNGTATVTPGGGTPAYTYSWNTVPVQTTATATGLIAGSYTVTITDANGCTTTAVANVVNSGGPSASISASTNISCFGASSGSATVSVSGGTGPYSYSWNSAPIQTTATATALPAGSYTVTVTDANNCVVTASVTLTQNPAITATQSQVNVLCNGACTGVATVVASGGTGSYTYLWAPSGGTGASATSLCAGNYTCTISSPAGCTITQSFTITEPPALTTTNSQVNELCNGGNTGSATVNPAGGTPAYSYSWNTIPVQTTATATGLTAGSYTCTVTDANGCTTTVSFTITQPTALLATTTFVQSTCGNANGTATVNISGGTPIYSVSWNTIPVQTTTTATGLLAGNYTATVTDANNCTTNATVTVTNAGSPTATLISSTNVSCFGGNNGDATVTAGSGTPPYTYAWNSIPVQTTATATALPAGNYTVTVTDANNCTATATVTITEPPALTISGTSTDVDCFGNATGTASVLVGSGSPGYSYSWNSAPVQTTANATGLIAGPYTCTVTDTNGCIITQSFTITEPPQLIIAVAGFNVSCFNACDGQVVVIPSGGTPNYTFSWSTGCTAPSCNAICAGTYTVDVTDANGCLSSASTSVTEPSQIVIATSTVDAHCNLADGSAYATANGGTGTLNFQWISGPANAAYNAIPAGSYSVIVTDANGCSDTATATVNNLNGVTASLTSVTNLTCFNTGNGAIVTGTAGGIAPYVYSWSAPAVSTTGSASSLSAGNYTLTVTDSSGCIATVTATVTEPADVTITASATPPAVCAGTGVQLSATGAGGTPAYNYSWLPGPLPGNTQNIIPTATTTYSVYVIDANGCSDSTTVLVTVNPLPVAMLVGDVLSGCAPLCMNFTDLSTIAAPGIIASGAWDFGDGSPLALLQDSSHCFNDPGPYDITLNLVTTDGCTATIIMPAYINVFANPVAAFSASPQPTTILNPMITFTDSSQNASTWNWSFGDLINSTSTLQNPTFTYPDPTCYAVVLSVTSIDGCVDTTSKEICIGPDVTLYIPNAFTPNDDGVNDIFYPVQIGIDPEKYEMWIFDRWGNMIFYTDDLAKGWDGHVIAGNEVAQIDTYVWRVKAVDLLGTKHNLVGKVSLVK